MNSPCNWQDKCDSVPLSSSPVPSSGSECDIAGSSHVSLPATSPPSVPSPETSGIQVSGHDDNSDMTENSVSASEPNLPLLSPFAIAKSEPLKSENIPLSSTNFQHSLRSIPSSPSIPSLPPESTSMTPPLVSNVLQSPFGIHSKSASFLSDDLFVSPEYSTSSEGRMHPGQEPEDIYCVANKIKDYNTLSDSGESAMGPPVTPRILNCTTGIMASSPFIADRPMYGSKEKIICAGMDNVDGTNPASNPLYQLSGESESARVLSATIGEPISTTESNASCTKASLLRNDASKSRNPLEKPMAFEHSGHRSPLKRPREPDDKDAPAAPKRMTLASQQKQHKKLASPFRSPLLAKPNTGNIFTPDRRPPCIGQPSSAPSALQRDGEENRPSTPITKLKNNLTRPRTPLSSSAKAKAPFKSPLVTSSPASTTSYVSNSRTTQELERKVQLLKRAIKIRKEDEEDKLEQLVKKWRAVGREAAWELWRIVRDNEESTEAPYPGTNLKSFGGSFDGGWGWAGTSGSSHSNGWGWDGPPESEAREDDIRSEELESPTKVERELFDALRKGPVVARTTMLPPTPRGAYFEQANAISTLNSLNSNEEAKLSQDNGAQEGDSASTPAKSLGTMLHQLGIAHDTLGWVEEEGDFSDA